MGTLSRASNAVSGNLNSWMHHLDPNLLKEKWSTEENKMLFRLHLKNGSHWKEIASYFPRRTDNGIKNQFFSIIRKSLRKACKIAGGSTNSASNAITNCISTTNINNVKPKILSEFLNLQYPCRKFKKTSHPEEEKKMTDFIQRFAFNKLSDIKNEITDDEKKEINDCINSLQRLKLYKK